MKSNKLLLLATGTAYILGIATGILAIQEHMRHKYQKLADEEVESVKEACDRRVEREKNEREQAEQKAERMTDQNLKNIQHYERLLKENGYTADNEPEKAVYIHPDESGDIEDYSVSTITYYRPVRKPLAQVF